MQLLLLLLDSMFGYKLALLHSFWNRQMQLNLFSRVQGHARTIATFGLKNWLAMVGSSPAFRLRSRLAQYPLEVRRGTTDLSVYRQVFVMQEYACCENDPEFILDCGANVGFTSAYLLTRFPKAELMAVEPDPGNYEQLVRNLAPYGNRARVIRGAVWSHSTRLGLAAPDYRGGGEYARQVRECGPDETETFPAFGINDLLLVAGRDRVDLLKMDIEGAEAVVFGRGHEAWIDRVGAMAVELHDDTTFGPATEIVSRATREFTATRSGELTHYIRSATVGN